MIVSRRRSEGTDDRRAKRVGLVLQGLRVGGPPALLHAGFLSSRPVTGRFVGCERSAAVCCRGVSSLSQLRLLLSSAFAIIPSLMRLEPCLVE